MSQVSFQICIVEDVALNRNIHSTILWHNQSNTKKSETKDVKGQRQSVIRPLLFKMLSMDQTLRHQLGSVQKHRTSGPPWNIWIRSHIWQDHWGIWMHTEIWDLVFKPCSLAHFGDLYEEWARNRLRREGWEAVLASAEQPASHLFGMLNPTPPARQISQGTKVGESLFWTNHLIFYMHNWQLPHSIREFYRDHIIVPWTLLESSEIYKVCESRKIFIGSVAGITSQLQK